MSDREWEAIEDFLAPEEQRLDLCEAWAPGGLVNDDVDHPCVVFLTDASITIDVRPQTLLEKPPVIHIDLLDILQWGAEVHPGGLRLMLVRLIGGQDMSVAVDLPRGRQGKKFAKQVEKMLGRDRRWRPGGR